MKKILIVISLSITLLSCTKSIEKELFFVGKNNLPKKPHWIEKTLHIDDNISSKYFINTHQQGQIPYITLLSIKDIPTKTSINELIDGIYDAELEYLAMTVKNAKYPIFIHFLPRSKNKNIDAVLYKNSYQYIVNFFKQQKAHNIIWLIENNIPDQSFNEYYPGRHYIDGIIIETKEEHRKKT